MAEETWSKARLQLNEELGTVGKTYKRLVSRFTDTNFGKTRSSPDYLHVGQILGGLIELTDYMATRPFKRSEDTYHCCQLLRDCTCFLACDEKYKRPGHLSKDDRFAETYKANPKFRRVWVAFLRQLVRYVEMLYEDEYAPPAMMLEQFIENLCFVPSGLLHRCFNVFGGDWCCRLIAQDIALNCKLPGTGNGCDIQMDLCDTILGDAQQLRPLLQPNTVPGAVSVFLDICNKGTHPVGSIPLWKKCLGRHVTEIGAL